MEETQSLLDLQVDQEASANLQETSRWGKFLGMVTVIAMILFILLCIVFWSQFDRAFAGYEDAQEGSVQAFKIGVVIGFVLVGLVFFILMNFLIKGANRIRNGIRNKDQLLFNSGLVSLKNYFAMYAVLGILGLVFTLIGLLNK